MCGIFGIVSLSAEPLGCLDRLESMAKALQHRGPDRLGLHREPTFGIGCQRLRVVDLEPRADQPFCDPRRRIWLVCNGEIYNSADLRQRYPDYPYRSQSDVEVILPLFLDRGPRGLAELDGMFGLAIWDASGTLVLARDRAGEKPLFFRQAGNEVWFASEVQALLDEPSLSLDLDHGALGQYLTLGYVREPRTMFRGIEKLEAGTVAVFKAASEKEVIRYWSPRDFLTNGQAPRPSLERLRSALRRAVHKQMKADVPVGVFVSGGLDSSLLATLAAQDVRDTQMHTFAARFSEASFDESEWAAACAGRLGTVHHEVQIDDRSMSEALAAVVEGLAEPLADPAILPTYLLAREARNHVTVVLSGEGADELFGGYPTYLGHRLIPWLRALPGPVLESLRALIRLLPSSHRKVTLGYLLKRFVEDADKPWVDRHLGWFGTGARSVWRQPTDAATIVSELADLPESLASAALLDYCTYLRDGLLVKVDRATMLSSIEARAPYLDRELTELALALPASARVRGLSTKYLLKEAAGEWLPRRIVHRRKRGLSVPVAHWVNAGLRPEVDRLLSPERLTWQQLFDPTEVGRLLAEHRAGRRDHGRAIWTLVMFQYWLERWLPDRATQGGARGFTK